MARLENDIEHVLERPVGISGLILDAKLEERHARWRVCSFLAIFDRVLNESFLLRPFIKHFPIELNFKMEDIRRKILNKMNKSVQTDLVQAVFCEDEAVFHWPLLASDFTTPQL